MKDDALYTVFLFSTDISFRSWENSEAEKCETHVTCDVPNCTRCGGGAHGTPVFCLECCPGFTEVAVAPYTRCESSTVSDSVHSAIGNIKGSDFKAGDLNNGDVIFDPPLPALYAHYLVFEQTNGEVNFDDVKIMKKEQFPLELIAAEHGLTLVTSKNFVADWEASHEEIFLQ